MPRQRFTREMEELRTAVRELAGAVDRQLDRAAQALIRGDHSLAREVRRDDAQINHAYAEVERRAVTLLAQQAPAAGDLRLILAALSAGTELERIADTLRAWLRW